MDTIIINPEAWTLWLAVKKLSQRTIAEYNYYLDKMGYEVSLTDSFFLGFLSNHNNRVARAFLINLITYCQSTYHDDDSQLKLLRIHLPKVTGRKSKRVIDWLSEDDVRLVEAKLSDERNKLMLLLTFYGGLRISELVGQYAIKPYDFNWNAWHKKPEEHGTLKLIGKGDKQRIVYIPQRIMARLFQYIRNEVAKKQDKDEPIFQISGKRWSVILESAGRVALSKHINPHLLRHSCSMMLRTKGWDLNQRKEYLGHEDVNTTAVYDHLTSNDLSIKFKDTMTD